MKIALFYSFFAALATAANIVAQDVLARMYGGPNHLWVSMGFGTGVGLVVKYMLDKRYIFRFHARDAAHHGRTFVLYTAMGLATTAIFWGFEFTFHAWFDGEPRMRYLGATIGLALGYWAKYHLDRVYVFKEAAA